MLEIKRKITIRVTEADYAAIKSNVKNAGMSLNEFITRACLRRKIEPMSPEHKKLLVMLNKTFGSMGNNINQMARIANQQKNIVDVAGDLQEIKKGLEEIWQYLKSAKGENH